MQKRRFITTRLAISLFLVVVIINSLSLAEAATPIFVDDSLFDTGELDLIYHTGSGRFSSYLTMNIPHAPVLKTCRMIEKSIKKKLINRGEAHITVITPPEYDNILKSALSIERIHQIAEQNRIQESVFDVVCIGSGNTKLNGQKEETFFFVVTSDSLIQIRQQIAVAFEAAGGKKGLFKAKDFYPHITIGFTKRDLHISDGVVKDTNSYDKRFRIQIGI